jgi:hypothetical protein
MGFDSAMAFLGAFSSVDLIKILRGTLTTSLEKLQDLGVA